VRRNRRLDTFGAGTHLECDMRMYQQSVWYGNYVAVAGVSRVARANTAVSGAPVGAQVR
jgi:hypothetical protein